MNKSVIIGNLTRDPEAGATSNGANYCRFTLAVNRNYTKADGKRETDFIPVVAWRNLADNVAKYCAKGSKVAVVGQITTNSYKDKNGNNRTSTEILAENVEFLNRKDDAAPPATEKKESTGQPGQTSMLDNDDDLPF